MIIKRINPNKLSAKKIDKKTTRVKALIINKDNNLIVGMTSGKYSYIGGHKEKRESLREAIYREVQEETGITLKRKKISPYLKIEKYNKNHFDTGKSCLSEVYYYKIRTRKKPSLENQQLDQSEIDRNFSIKTMKVNDFLKDLDTQDPSKKELYQEMREAITTLNEIGKRKRKKYEKKC